MDRLAGGQRFNRGILGHVAELLKEPECADELLRGMSLSSRSIRRHCFRIAAQAPQFEAGEIIARAIKDSDVLVRRWAFTAGAERLPDDRIELRRQAARDSYAPIRRMAFEALDADPASQASDFEVFLLDRSTAIRRESQVLTTRRFGLILSDFYRDRLQIGNAKQIEVAMLGVAETGGKQDEAAIIAFLCHRAARIRCAALRALRMLGIGCGSSILLNTIAGDKPAAVREAAMTLFAERKISAESIWAAVAANPDRRARIGILHLLQSAGKWAQIRLYLEAAADSEPSVSKRAIELLALWVRKFNATFTQPTPADQTVIQGSMAAVWGLLPLALSRELSFIVDRS
jgi:hypothetical protein